MTSHFTQNVQQAAHWWLPLLLPSILATFPMAQMNY